MRILGLVGSLVLLFGATGCPTPPVVSAATVQATSLPDAPSELAKVADDYYQKGDPISLENAVVAYDKLLHLEPHDYDVAWKAARAAFAVADAAQEDEPRRAKFSQDGIRYAKQAIALKDGAIEGHYYLALNNGYLAKTKNVGALNLLPEIQKEAQRCIQLDEKFDHAGPHRLLGELLTHAPGWPSSIGDVDEGAAEMKKAVEIAPDFPPNHIFYADALLANDKCDEAKKELDVGMALKPTGDPFLDKQIPRWRQQGDELRKKLDERC